MAGVARESSFMPAIKCSNCGNDVEISMMGDHVCGGPGGAPAPAPAPASAPAPAPAPAPTDAEAAPTTTQQKLGALMGFKAVVDTFRPLGGSVHDKIGEIPPVDTAMANRSNSRQPLTPSSFAGGAGAKSPRTPGPRPSASRPDDYYPQDDEAPQYAQSNRSSPYGGFGDRDPGSRPPPAVSAAKPGLNLLTRLDDIAAGPYAAGNERLPTRRKPSEDRGRMGPSTASPPRLPRKTGYGGFGPPGTDLDDPNSVAPSRAEGFLPSGEKFGAPLQAPSALASRPDLRLRDTSRPPPPRTSLVRARQNASINLDAEFGAGNPFHSPTTSVASSLSRGSSQLSHPSSTTSPARSAFSNRRGSDDSTLDKPDGGVSYESLLNQVKSPVSTRSKMLPPTPDPDEDVARQRRPTGSNARYDAAMSGRRPPSPPASNWDYRRQDPGVQTSPPRGRNGVAPELPTDARRREAGRQKSKGLCRACSQEIFGKSVSSADGRLSGRYHKTCFTCTSCFEPFATAEFYVHDDRPYCKRHYHKVNGSLCGTCKLGIEGQYLEDETATKHHLQCFRCEDCQRPLQDGYFEVNGLAYCERDAYRRMQPSRRTPSMSSQSSQRSYGSSPLAPPGRPGMRPPPGPPRSGLPANGRMGVKGPGMGLAPPNQMPMARMEKRRTRIGMMGAV